MTTLQLTEREQELLAELLQHELDNRKHELFRTDSLSYKQILRTKLAVIEGLCSKVTGEPILS